MTGMLNIGLSGLNAAQLQLNTTSHNIVNAGTQGYNRQAVIQSTNDPIFSGVGFFGQGARIAAVTRQYNQFLENQVLTADNRRSEFSAYSAQISQINNLLADPQAGLSPAMQQFFAGVQEVAANPTSVPARQALISSAQALVARFQTMDARLTEIREGVEGQLSSTVERINMLAGEIAQLNQRIVVAQAAGPGVPANDLLDQRNEVIAELNRLVKTSTVVETDGQVNVFIGTGQPLVLGQTVSRLGMIRSPNDPTRQSIALVAPNGAAMQLPERLLNGGELGGLLSFRRDTLDVAQNQLGLIALGLATEFNRVHRLGVDLEGEAGIAFFRAPTPAVTPSGLVAVDVDPAAVGALTASDYKLSYDGTSYTITNQRTGDSFASNTPAFDFQGLRIDASAMTSAGEVLIQPTRYAARDIAVSLTDPRKIAAGLPIGSPMTVSTAPGNGGTGVVSHVSAIGADVPNFPTITLTFDGSELSGLPPGYTLVPDTTFDPVTDAGGKNFTVTSPDGHSFGFRLSGSPVPSDQFVFAAATDRVADNRNAVALGALQTSKTMLADSSGATASFQSVYSHLVTTVGNKTREVQVGEQAQESLLRQAKDARESLSGVNLDEEAANLLRYQQAYQASGRVMAMAQRLFDEIVSIGR
jgi:flagellar hook-associated protein 1 FlgK